MQLTDQFGREIRYLRLSVTDRCNLRCFYCMPEEGIHFLPKDQLLSYEEMIRLCGIFTSMGVDKIRITGGEPFVRKDLIGFIGSLADNKQIKKLSLTTNGILTRPYLSQLKACRIQQINLSLDSLDAQNFHKITRRDEFDNVMSTFHQMLDEGFAIKINAVVMPGINDHEIVPLAELAMNYPVSVRFIEEMPFNGTGSVHAGIKWDHVRILAKLKSRFPDISPVPAAPNSTSQNYTFYKAMGDVGIIAAFSRTFCGTCDRIRITSTGEMRTCLYGHNVLDLKALLRQGERDEVIRDSIVRVVQKRARDGFEAEKLRGTNNPIGESMSVIGG
ncbi:MAG: GTP 3',8-cyclase MoaA [Cyclobacteriaceae bacterium]|nr:GTP 3',8-cyclase MoaA [Cyclobacteriaceae bacterium]